MSIRLTRGEVADVIEAFINGTDGGDDWDDFISIRIKDPELEKIRVRCARLRDEFPPEQAKKYCSQDGIRALRSYVEQLRTTGISRKQK